VITFTRRNTIAAGVLAALAIAASSSSVLANQHPHPHKGSLEYLDRNSYAKNMRVLGVFQLGEERGHKLQMMAIGSRRLMLQNGDVIDVTDPRAPKLVKHGAFKGSQLQVAYNKKLGKWILVTGASSPITSTTATAPNGKYDDPSLIEQTKQGPGLRGIRIWDATDPTNIAFHRHRIVCARTSRARQTGHRTDAGEGMVASRSQRRAPLRSRRSTPEKKARHSAGAFARFSSYCADIALCRSAAVAVVATKPDMVLFVN